MPLPPRTPFGKNEEQHYRTVNKLDEPKVAPVPRRNSECARFSGAIAAYQGYFENVPIPSSNAVRSTPD